VDVVNSQPLLLGLSLLGEGLDGGVEAYRDWLADPTNSPPPTRIPPSSSHHPILIPTPTPYLGTYSDGRQGDVGAFIELCLGGAIYERLMDLTGFDRATAKKEFFHVAYGRVFTGSRSRMGKAFMRAFPDCWDGVCRLKEGGYAELARRMQVVESCVVVWRACSRLMEEYPRAPLLTLHDCLVTDEEHVHAFAEVLREEFRAVFGVAPKATVKAFGHGPGWDCPLAA
jgi:hypothetical protein